MHINFEQHRQRAFDAMEDNTLLLVYAGIPVFANGDEYHHFEANANFFYLTGLEREKQALLLYKCGDIRREFLFIEKADAFTERWTGKMPTPAEVAEVAGIPEGCVMYTESLDGMVSRYVCYMNIQGIYMDTFRCQPEDMDHYNLLMAKRMRELYPTVSLKDLHFLLVPLRTRKDEDEIGCIEKAISVTGNSLREVLKRLEPGMMEYQVQAIFEGSCAYQGERSLAFPTIAGSGLNACSMHYDANDARIADGSLILLDLGARHGNYCSDITRTYPANGRFSSRQRELYDLVLKANRAVRDAARPGITLRQLNDITCKVLGEGLVTLGLIGKPEEVGKYYMHSVSHHLGIDAHDVFLRDEPLVPGCVITDEPGLYVDEEETGIRIEDDLLITEDGCVCLSEDIARDAETIESLMVRAE